MNNFNYYAKIYLNVLSVFLREQALEYGYFEEELCSVLGDMSPFIWTHRKPADPGVWQHWEEVNEEIFKKLNISSLTSASFITKEQAFMAAFNMLHYEFWESNNNVTIGEALKEINVCLKDLDNKVDNKFWDTWLRYLDAEKENKYDFEYIG